MVVTDRVYIYSDELRLLPRAPAGDRGRRGYSNLTVNSVWDLTDLTYVLQGTLIIDGAYTSRLQPERLAHTHRCPVTTAYGPIPTPVVSLTIQAALPGTLLADGETIPSPGQSVIVKLLNDNTPHDAGAANLATTFGSTGIDAVRKRGSRIRRRRRRRRRSPHRPAGRSGCLLRAAHPGHPRQPDDRPAARAGDHHLAARRHGRHHGPRRGHGQHLEQRPVQQYLAAQAGTTFST